MSYAFHSILLLSLDPTAQATKYSELLLSAHSQSSQKHTKTRNLVAFCPLSYRLGEMVLNHFSCLLLVLQGTCVTTLVRQPDCLELLA